MARGSRTSGRCRPCSGGTAPAATGPAPRPALVLEPVLEPVLAPVLTLAMLAVRWVLLLLVAILLVVVVGAPVPPPAQTAPGTRGPARVPAGVRRHARARPVRARAPAATAPRCAAAGRRRTAVRGACSCCIRGEPRRTAHSRAVSPGPSCLGLPGGVSTFTRRPRHVLHPVRDFLCGRYALNTAIGVSERVCVAVGLGGVGRVRDCIYADHGY